MIKISHNPGVPVSRRPRSRFGAVLMSLALLGQGLAGCSPGDSLPGEDALEPFGAGAAKADVLNALPGGSYTEEEGGAVLRGYPVSRHLRDGNMVEVLWVTPPTETEAIRPPRESRTPVVFVNDVLEGWGWDVYDRSKEAWELPEPREPGEVLER